MGGSGTLAAQAMALYSNTATGDAALSAAVATDDGIFQGTAGTVTFGVGYALNSATFNTTNYVLTPGTTTARVFSAPITLAANVNLNLIEATQTADRTLGIASVTGGTGSTLTLQGAETGSSSARINIAVANSTISVPTTISGAGTSLAGFVATAIGETITNTITNNSNFTTLIAAIISGSAGVQFSAGTSGGAGPVTINSANTYSGATTLNNSTTGVIRLGVDNALPMGTALQFGVGANATGALDLNGHSQTVGSLAVTGTAGANGIANASATTAALTISGTANTTYSSTIGIPANVSNLTGANNNISLTLAAANTGSLTLSGVNPYTGATKIGGGTLVLSSTGSINGSTSVQVAGTGALTLTNATALADAGTLSLVKGTTLNLNAASGTETIGALILDGTAEPAGTYSAATLNTLDTTNGLSNITFTSMGETLTVVPEPTTVIGGLLMVGALGWNLYRRFSRRTPDRTGRVV